MHGSLGALPECSYADGTNGVLAMSGGVPRHGDGLLRHPDVPTAFATARSLYRKRVHFGRPPEGVRRTEDRRG